MKRRKRQTSMNWNAALKRSSIIVLGPLWMVVFVLTPLAYPLIWIFTGRYFYDVMDWWAYKIDDWIKWIDS